MEYEAETTAFLWERIEEEEKKRKSRGNSPKDTGDVDYTRTTIRAH
jgi:hypothetical protein